MKKCDVVIIGAGLAGLTAACELIDKNRKVIIVDQENRLSLGGQAHWSLGGLFMIDTPEQRRMGIKDSAQLAYQDWMGSAQFDRKQDYWPKIVAENYLEFANGPMRAWLHALGIRWFPVVGWAERGGSMADGHGNSVPRFHLTWGTGPGVLAPFIEKVLEAEKSGQVELCFRHRVESLLTENGAIKGVSGSILYNDSSVERSALNSDHIITDFTINAENTLISSGGIGGNFDLVRKYWPQDRLGSPPNKLISGVPAHVDGSMIDIGQQAGAQLINMDRMWHYTEGVTNYDPIWPNHGIRILPGPSSLWVDATGKRLPAPCMPGFDTLSTLKHIVETGFDYSWFILTQKIIEKEFALSGSEQNPDFTSKSWQQVLKSRLAKGAPQPVEAFKEKGEDFIVANHIQDLVAGMNKLVGSDRIDAEALEKTIRQRDQSIDNPFSKDTQITAIHGARRYLGDKLVRTAKPHKLLDPTCGPLIAVRLNILTRKSLGGLHTNLDGQVFDDQGDVIQGLYAAGEACGFGGGGYHGYNALEGTFLGGCLFTGRKAGKAMA